MSHVSSAAESAGIRPDGAVQKRPFKVIGNSDNSRTPAEFPIEIAFLEPYGVGRDLLRRATEAAKRCGVDADAALLGEGLVSDERFYQALAMRLGAPYYFGEWAIDDSSDVE